MRVLHVIETTGDSAHASRAAFASMASCAAHIKAHLGDEHRVVLVGDEASRAQAYLAGLRVDRLARAPLGLSQLAWSALSRESVWGANEVWVSTPALKCAAEAGIRRGVRVRVTDWTASGNPQHGGDRADRAARVGSASRQTIRATLGAGPAETVVALLADPPAEGDARRFAFVLGVVEVGVGPVVAVMSAGSSQLVRGRSLHRLAVRRSALQVVRGSVVPWLPGADVALVEGARTNASAWAARHALSLGVTLVGPSWLDAEFPREAGSRVFTTDGRMRSMLPAMLRAIEASRASGRHDEDGQPAPGFDMANASTSSSLA